MPEPTQSYATHTKLVPAYHYLTFAILTLNLGWSVWQAIRHLSFATVLGAALAIALILIALYARTFALTVQDRVIRLEERLRLEKLLPADLVARIPEINRSQFVALRFASDEEVTELVREVLSGNLRSRDEIKKRVRNWRADHLRA
jgi:Family of unknown function (DUF6526)